MKKKLATVVLAVLMLSITGCGEEAAKNTQNIETTAKQEDAVDGKEESEAEEQGVEEQKVEELETEEQGADEDSAEETDGEDVSLSDHDSLSLYDRANFARVIQYLECKNYDQFIELIDGDRDENTIAMRPEFEGSDVYMEEIMYDEYDDIKIDGILYNVKVTYLSATNETIGVVLVSSSVTKKECLSLEQFALDYFGSDYEIPDLHIGGELGEALENAYLYRYTWDKGGDVNAAASAMLVKDEYTCVIGWYTAEQ